MKTKDDLINEIEKNIEMINVQNKNGNSYCMHDFEMILAQHNQEDNIEGLKNLLIETNEVLENN